MKGKTLLALLGLAVILAVVVFLRTGNETSTNSEIKMGDRLFANLQVNSVASISIIDEQQRITLKKSDSGWQVAERDGYPANFDAIRDLVISFSRMKVGRDFTATPEALERLSLQPPSSEASKGRGISVTLKDETGKSLVDVVLGQTRMSGNARSGQYLKPSDGHTIFLVDGSFRFLKAAPEDWLSDEILNIRADAIESITAYGTDPDRPMYTLSKPQKDDPAQMAPIPTGRAVNPEKINQAFEALGPLTLHDVRLAEGAPAGSIRLVYRLYDGRQITVWPGAEGEDQYTIRVAAALSETTPVTSQNAATESNEGAGAFPAEPAATSSDDPQGDETRGPGELAANDTAGAESPETINAKLGAWVFFVQKWQYDSLITDPELLLVPLPQNP